ncbi:MAG: site-specific integrase [Actinobacteria bacterium]|nr:site-specific integrase [Actinomycetota bacterium]
MGARVWVPVVSGPLAPWAAGYGSWLTGRGYSPFSVGHRLWQLERLSRWLSREGLLAGELTPERVGEFLRAQRAAGYVSWVSPRSTALPLGYLRGVGVVPVPTPAAAEGPVEEVLEGYRRYLLLERGVSERTVVRYEPDARLFISQLEGLELVRLSAADVSGFLARECPRRSVAGARQLAFVMRSLLGYLHMAGLIGAPLQWAVPGVADLRDRSLPRGLEPAVVAKLLAGCDRRRTVGRRDYAILLLLVRLGLRAGEVAAIQLDDVDWRGGEILVRGKGSRHDRLPLPADVGEALVSYLRRRPRAECRALFLRVLAPAGALGGTAIGGVVNDACVRAGVPPVGPHRLRHTAATGMLRAGASLPEIAQVLRHHNLKTTAIYAKVDRTALRALALPWPGGGA